MEDMSTHDIETAYRRRLDSRAWTVAAIAAWTALLGLVGAAIWIWFNVMTVGWAMFVTIITVAAACAPGAGAVMLTVAAYDTWAEAKTDALARKIKQEREEAREQRDKLREAERVIREFQPR